MNQKALKIKLPSMSSSRIVEILKSQHSKDVFVSECKDGPSWSGGHARMDVWTMTRSWSRLCFTGYEIKVSRADFKQDNKWHAYLPLCNQLYFVCPKGMIQPDEVPDGVGLKWCNESRASTIKKASHREVVPPMELFCYILMCRSAIKPPHFFNTDPETKVEKMERFKKWLNEKEESRRLGSIVGKSIAFQMDRINDNNAALLAQIKRLELVEQFARELGISHYDIDSRVRDKLVRFKSLLPENYVKAVRLVGECSKQLVSILEGHRDDTNE